MKARTKQKIAKWFAALVVLVMIFQVLMPLFSSGVVESSVVSANVSTASTKSPEVSLGTEVAVPAQTSTTTETAPVAKTETVKQTPAPAKK